MSALFVSTLSFPLLPPCPPCLGSTARLLFPEVTDNIFKGPEVSLHVPASELWVTLTYSPLLLGWLSFASFLHSPLWSFALLHCLSLPQLLLQLLDMKSLSPGPRWRPPRAGSSWGCPRSSSWLRPSRRRPGDSRLFRPRSLPLGSALVPPGFMRPRRGGLLPLLCPRYSSRARGAGNPDIVP